MSLVEPGTPAQLAERASDAFTHRFGRPPAVVGRAPGRVNLIGEHTDYNGGLCLPVALPHATYAACATRADGVLRIASAGFEEPWEGRLVDLAPGSVTGWAAYAAGVVWALAEDGLEVPGLDVALESTVPVGGGLSSSAAVECAVAVAVAALAGAALDDALRHRLLAACIRAESEMAGAPTGGMDQAIALFAAPDTALLLDFDAGTQSPVSLPLGGSGVTLLVINTGVSHALTDGVVRRPPGRVRPRRRAARGAGAVPGAGLGHALRRPAGAPDPAHPHRERPGAVGRLLARQRGLGRGGPWRSPPRTPPCATTSRSAAPSSTRPWTPPSRPAPWVPG